MNTATKNARALVWERDDSRCVRCDVCCAPAWSQHGYSSLQHRVKRSQGGPDTPENMILMCGWGTTGCHGWVEAHPRIAHDKGWSLRSHEDPATTPVWISALDALVLLSSDGQYLPVVQDQEAQR